MSSIHRSTALAAALLAVATWHAAAQETSPRQRDLEDRMVNTRLVLGVKKTYASGLTSPFLLDTTWVGHSYTNHFSPTENWWNLYTGEVLPGATTNPANAMWDWDHTTGIPSPDSLEGWWPVRMSYDLSAGLTLSDENRPWWALDYGNQANYVINQGAGAKRTKGVVGVWHSDPGNSAGSAVTWPPISGGRSAWCGLRQHGDNSVVDPITGNPFNQSVMEFNGPARPSSGGGTAAGFPGYASQWDQLLYRDVQPPGGSPMTISFKYRTLMSTDADRGKATRAGWFHGDPLAVVSGNFISSSSSGLLAPVDSFMVYVGVPVDDAACLYSDGVTRPVHDPLRRWFSEVLRLFDGAAPYFEIFSTSGANPGDTLASTPMFMATVPAGQIDAIRLAPGNGGQVVRLVFRVKTNRGFDDESSATSAGVAFTSRGRGAAIVDDVVVNGATIGDFEATSGLNAIDNAPGLGALLAWKSTGKPPAVYFHPHDLSSLLYQDVSGAVDSPNRLCDMTGTVISVGNHDQDEVVGASYPAAERELMTGMVSPTINLVTSGPPNSMGITPGILDATDDWYIRYDVYTGAFDQLFTGSAWTIGFQSYPAKQWNGAECWGPIRVPDFQMHTPEPQCLYDVENGFSNGLIVTSKASGIPDSLRLYIGITNQCFRFGVTLGCNFPAGGYFDNVALGFVDVGSATLAGNTSARQAMSLLNDQWFGDAFPFNHVADPMIPAQFDTTSALVKTYLNIAPRTGNPNRAYVLGDSAVIMAPGDQVRLDLVFRIRPGPGNAVVAGQMDTGLRQVPTSAMAASPNDGSFWGQYLASNAGGSGFGTPGGHVGGKWNPLVWNSARCDTAEKNLFPIAARGNLAGITPGLWESTYHESDLKFATLGTARFRCFVVDTTKAAESGPIVTNVVCDGTLPAWITTVPQTRTGFDGSTTTQEFSKILPDGLFTPGTNIQYFYRKSYIGDPVTEFTAAPDTHVAWPQRSKGQDFDFDRFESMGILPNQWSVPAYDTLDFGGEIKPAIGFTFRGGSAWFGIMALATGWARQDINVGGVQASAEGVAYGKAGLGLCFGGPHATDVGWLLAAGYEFKVKTPLVEYGKGQTVEMCKRPFGDIQQTTSSFTNTQLAPTPAMLRRYFLLLHDPGAYFDGVVQPYRDHPLRAVDLFSSYIFDRVGIQHGLWIMRGAIRSVERMKNHEPQLSSFEPLLHAGLRAAGAGRFIGAPLGPGSTLRLRLDPAAPLSGQHLHGVWAPPGYDDDVLEPLLGPAPQDGSATTSSSGVPAAYYDEPGLSGPYVASIYSPSTSTYPCITLVDGFGFDKVVDRTGSGKSEVLPYAHHVLSEIFAPLGLLVPPNQAGVEPGDGPPLRPSVRVLGNPLRSDAAAIRLAVPRTAFVEASLHDIAGRRVRILAERVFAPGEHDLPWDGSGSRGQRVAPGVYLLRVRINDIQFTSNTKLVVLR